MSRAHSMTATAVQSAFEREAADDFVSLLEITLQGTAEPLRFVNQAIARMQDADGFDLEDNLGTPVYGCVHKGKIYYYLPFTIPMPTSEAGQAPSTNLDINNLTRELMPHIREIQGKAAIRIIIVHTSDMNRVQAEFTGLEINTITYNSEMISATLGMDMLTETAYPAYSYTPDRFPGMF